MTDQELATIYTSKVRSSSRYKELPTEQKKFVDAIVAFLSTGGPNGRISLESEYQLDRMFKLAERRA